MRGFESDTKQHNPKTLSPNQKAVFEFIEKPSKYPVLYEAFKELMPESSVRRIMASLLSKGLAEKTKSGRWRQVKVE